MLVRLVADPLHLHLLFLGIHEVSVTLTPTVELKDDYILGLIIVRYFYRNYFTGLGRLGNIYRNSGVSTENER